MPSTIRLIALLTLTALYSAAASAVGLKTLDGKAQGLDDYIGKGQWTVVQFWAHDCPMCKREAPEVNAFHERMKKEGIAEVVGISVDGESGHLDAQQFIDDHELTNTNLIIEPMGAAMLLARTAKAKFVGTPTYMVFDRKGELQGGQAGAVPMKSIEKFIRERDQAK